MIQTEKLSRTYGTHQALADLDLRAEPGEILGFLGPNGAGKSTFISRFRPQTVMLSRPVASCVYAVVLGVVCTGTASPIAQADLALTYRLPTKLTLHEPVVLQFGAFNGAASVVSLDLGYRSLSQFRFELVRPDASVVNIRPTQPGEASGFGTLDKVDIRQRRQYSQSIVLSE